MLGRAHRLRCEPPCTDVIEALRDHPQGIIHLRLAGPATLPPAPLAFDLALHVADQCLALKTDDVLHVVQQLAALPTWGFDVLLLRYAEVPESLIDCIFSSLGMVSSVTLSFTEPT